MKESKKNQSQQKTIKNQKKNPNNPKKIHKNPQNQKLSDGQNIRKSQKFTFFIFFFLAEKKPIIRCQGGYPERDAQTNGNPCV